jgi:hypothetical protein
MHIENEEGYSKQTRKSRLINYYLYIELIPIEKHVRSYKTGQKNAVISL